MDYFAYSLLDWYDKVKRDLPWRHNVTPYSVWVSEIMLQQTRVEAVVDYYRRWMQELPTVWDLAAASDDHLHKLWEGLGYYSRVQNLKKAAIIVCERYGGVLPSSWEALRTLPGVGDYTAGAIASIAFGLPCPAVDGNVLRVLARLAGDVTDIMTPQARRNAVETLSPLIPKERVGDFTQAMFEWGALLCTPTSPKCAECPFQNRCVAFKEGRVQELPVRINKTARKEQDLTVLVLRCSGKYALTPPREKGLLSGLYGLPLAEGHLEEKACKEWAKAQGFEALSISRLPDAKHVFTHITWRLWGYLLQVAATDDRYVWASCATIAQDYALPTAFGAYKPYLE